VFRSLQQRLNSTLLVSVKVPQQLHFRGIKEDSHGRTCMSMDSQVCSLGEDDITT